MRFEFTQINQVLMHYFKFFSRAKSIQRQKVRIIQGNESKLTQSELLLFSYFKSIWKLLLTLLLN